MASRKTLGKKTKTISSVSVEDMSSKSKGTESCAQFSVGGVDGDRGEYQESCGWGFLAPRELLGYRCALGQDVPAPDSGKIVVFVDFFRRGFGVSIHWFVQDLLRYHDTQVHHLTTNLVRCHLLMISRQPIPISCNLFYFAGSLEVSL